MDDPPDPQVKNQLIGEDKEIEDTRIAEIANECQKGIARLLEAAISEDSCVKGVLHGRDIQQIQERYDQWAGNLGALWHYGSSLSLEHRLRDAPLISESILGILENLHVSTQAGKRPQARLIG